jgi:hypothetical protein
MPHFTKRLEIANDYVNFYFNLIYTAEGLRYHVSFVGKDRHLYAFNMKDSGEEWVLVDPANCPNMIIELEPTLSKLIAEHKPSSL